MEDGNPVVAADETPVAAPEEVKENALNPENEQAKDLPDEEHEPEKEKQPKWARRALAHMGRQKLKERDRAEKAEAEAERLRKENEELRIKSAQTAPADMPRQDAFETVEEFTAAMAEWKFNQLDKVRQEKASIEKSKAVQSLSDQEFEKRKDKMYDAGIEKFGDEFIEKIAAIPGTIMTRAVADDVLAADNPALVANFLADHLEEAAKLAAMDPRARAMTIARIETRLASKPATQKSKAPEPINPVSGKGTIPDDDESKMSDEEWWKRKKARKAGGA